MHVHQQPSDGLSSICTINGGTDLTVLIKAKDLSFAYDGKIAAEKLNFEVCENEYICIVGENGSGKSTLLKGLLKLITPFSGSAEYDSGAKPEVTGYLPQQTSIQRDFPAGVFEVVLSGRLNSAGLRPFYSKADKEAALLNMQRTGISDLRKMSYRELSGGQQQRVLLARALCAAKKIIYLDEPAAGLDPLAAQEMYSQIYELNKNSGIAVVMVSHDINAAVKYADKILHLSRTQLFFGTAGEYAASDLGISFSGGMRDV